MNQRFPSRRASAAIVRARRAPMLETLERRHLMAGWSPVGPETLVNDTTAGIQETTFEGRKAVASDDNGRYVVVWSGSGTGDADGIYARLFDASGALGPSFRVNTATAGVQTEAAVTMDNSGRFVVVWSSNGQDGSGWGVYGQRFDATGAAAGAQFRVNTTTAGNQNQPSIASDADGDFVVTWTSENTDGTGLGIAGQRYNVSGVAQGGEIDVNGYTDGNQILSAVAMDDAGAFTVVWQSDYTATSSIGIFSQRFTPAGAPSGIWSVVNTTTNGFQLAPSIGMNATGAYVVAWTSDSQDGSGRGIFAQRYTSAGARTGGEFGVNATTSGDQQYPSVAVDNTGAFVIAWESAAQDASGWGAYAREYTAAGVSIGAEFRLNTTTASDQQDVFVAPVGNGDYVATWSGNGVGDSSGVFLQRFEDLAAGVTVTPTTGLVTSEAGAAAGFSVVLTSRPTANVTISITSADLTEGTVSTAVLTFTRNNWNVAQTVTVTGVDDALNDGNVAYTIQTGAATSTDADYSGRAVADVSATNVDTTPPPNAPPAVITTSSALQYVENSGAVAVDPGLTVSDANDASLAGAVVSILGFVSGQDVLGFVDGGGITGAWDAATGTLTLGGVATVAAYQAALRSITYLNNSDNPNTSGRTVRFVVNDGQANSAPVSRGVVVNAVNDPPVANDETYAGEQGTVLSVPAASGLLANDTDVDGGGLSASLLHQAGNGTVQVFANGSFTYTPAPGFWGTDQFVYTADDGAGGTDTATVTVQVARGPGVTVAPTSGLVTNEMGGSASFTVVLDRAPAADVTISLASSDTTEGTLSIPSLTFTPANWNLPQSVTVTGVDDGVDDGDQAYVVVVAAAVSADPLYDGLDALDVSLTNLALPPRSPGSPVVMPDSYRVGAGGVLTVAPAGVLANDTSTGGLPMRASIVLQTAHGVVSLGSDGGFVYVPAAGFAGTDRFTYSATNANGSTWGDVTIEVEPGVIDPEPDPEPDGGDPVVVPVPRPPLSLPGVEGDDEGEGEAPEARDEPPLVVITPRAPMQEPTSAGQTVSGAEPGTPGRGPGRPVAPSAVVHARATPAARFLQRTTKVESEDEENLVDAAPQNDPAGPPAARSGSVPQFGSVQGVQPTALLTAVGPLATKLQAMGRQMGAADASHDATIRSVSQVALAMTAGYVMWSLRGASLLASLLTSLPLWRSLDPLPILEGRADRDKAKAVAKRRKKSRRKNGPGGPGEGRDDDEKLGNIVN